MLTGVSAPPYAREVYEGRLILHQRDPLEYRFCSPKWAASRVAAEPGELERQARALDVERCRRVVFAGGSPLEHPHFRALVDLCTDLGLQRFALETDGPALAADGNAAWLAEHGFRQVFVVLGSVDPKRYALLSRLGAETLEVAQQGVRDALDAGLDTYLVVPLIRQSAADFEALVAWAAAQRGGADGKARIKGVLLALPEVAQVPAAARKALLTHTETGRFAALMFRKLQRKRLEYGFTVKRGVPPCSTEGDLDLYGSVFHDRIAFFKHGRQQEFSRVDACGDCCLQHTCPGVEKEYVEHFGGAEFRPVPLEAALDWKLKPLNTLEQIDYKQVSPFDNPFTGGEMSLLRVNGHCNMACSFCFVDRTVGDGAIDGILAEIKGFADAGTRHLIVSGGEPTLHPRLPEIIAAARDMGIHSIEMQSNGVKAQKLEYARELADAGLTMVTLSLHSTDPEKSDSITKLPKAFWKTMQGMHNFRACGVTTQIACVITKMNYQELPSYVRFLRNEFPEAGGHLSICFAIAQGISDLVFPWVIPRFSEIKPYFRDALDYCLETGVGFGGMIGQGGYPPCMLDGDLRYYERVIDKIYKSDDHDEQFYKAEACGECVFNQYCVGVRRAYVECYGDDEISPIREPPADFPVPLEASA